MALTVGTDTYIAVADAKLLAVTLSEEGVSFEKLSASVIEQNLTFALNEIEELNFIGRKRGTDNALQFPRDFVSIGDADPGQITFGTAIIDGTYFAAKAQVYNAISIGLGSQRQPDRRIIQENENAFTRMSTYQELASLNAFALLDQAGYIQLDSPIQGGLMLSNRRRNFKREIISNP